MMYNRYCAIVFPRTDSIVGGANRFIRGQIETPIRVEASVKMTAESPPNDAEVKIYNLSRQTLEDLMSENEELEILAGYAPEGTAQYIRSVFKGKIRSTVTQRDGVNLVATIMCGDGDEAISQARVNQKVQKDNVSNGQVNAAAAAMATKGVEKGFINCPTVNAGRTVTLNGDSARKVLDDVAWTTDCVWYITDGKLNFHPRDNPLETTEYELTPENGLIGSPVISDDGIYIQTLVIADLRPGYVINVRSQTTGNARINGSFMIEEIDWSLTNGGGTHSGVTHSGAMKLKAMDGDQVRRKDKRMGGGVT